MSSQSPLECCAYIYTSGTTGAPKAVMISHDNIVFESRAALEAIEVKKKMTDSSVPTTSLLLRPFRDQWWGTFTKAKHFHTHIFLA